MTKNDKIPPNVPVQKKSINNSNLPEKKPQEKKHMEDERPI